MRLIYLDEAGIGAIKNPILTVAAVIVNGDGEMPRINRKAQEIVIRNLPEKSWSRFEFKADSMFSHYCKFGTSSRHLQPMKDFLSLMRDANLPIVHSVLHTVRFANQEKAAKSALTQDMFVLAHAIGETARWFKENASNESGLCIADHGTMETMMKTVVRDMRQGIPSIEFDPFANLVDTVYFGDSKISIGLQMADFAATFLRLHLIGDARVAPFYQIIEPCFIGLPIVWPEGEGQR